MQGSVTGFDGAPGARGGTPALERRGESARLCWLALLIVSSVLVGALFYPLFTGGVYIAQDLGRMYLPARAFYSRAIANGWDFDWWPDIHCGFYLHGSGELGAYHPLHWLLYRLLPLPTAFVLENVLPYLVLLIGMFLLLRRLQLGREESLFGAFLFTFSGWFFLRLIHILAVQVVAHLPWNLLAVRALARSRDWREAARAGGVLSLLTASQCLQGIPPLMLPPLAVEALFGLYLFIREAHAVRRAAAWMAAKALGAAIGAVQLLPMWEFAGTSTRSRPTLDFIMRGSLHPANLLQLLAPYSFHDRIVRQHGHIGNAHEFTTYLGAVALPLLVWLFLRRRELGEQRRLALGIAVLGVVGLVLAMGEYAGVYGLLARIPPMNRFRAPCRFLVLTHLAAAAASALALGDILRLNAAGRPVPWRRLRPLLAVPVASVFTLIACVWLSRDPLSFLGQQVHDSSLALLLGPCLSLLATTLVVMALRGRGLACAAIIALAAADLGLYGLSHAWNPAPLRLPELLAPYSQSLPETEGFERVEYRALRDNILTMLGARTESGYATLDPTPRLDYESEDALRVAGVRWRQDAPERISTMQAPRVEDWHPLAGALPYVRCVTRSLKTSDPARDLSKIDIQTSALVEEDLHLEAREPGVASVEHFEPGHIRVEATCPSRQLLVLAERYNSGWSARSEGGELQILVVNGDFMGVVLDKGRQLVTFRFAPRLLKLGKEISMIALLVSALLLSVSWIRAPRGTGGRIIPV